MIKLEKLLAGSPQSFIWASGIENTFVPQTRPGHRALDEYELMGHYQHWREDLALARELGVDWLRWGIPWYRVEPRQGEFDWRWTDEVLPYMVQELGITPIIDLMHYGCPLWLKREFANPGYPQAVAAYAAAFARRYKHLVSCYTPLNESLVNALYCGRRGLWPPYLRGDRGYIRVLLQLMQGVVETVEALKQADPQALLVHVEAAELTRSARADLAPLALEDQLRNFLSYDLLLGKVTTEHPLFSWLLRNDAPPDVLARLAQSDTTIDIMGLNFYPQWSTRELYVKPSGQVADRAVEKDGSGFAELLESYYRRYGIPLMVTETSAYGGNDERSGWLNSSLAAIKELRRRGIPVLGYTWFPLFTMIDWRYRFGRHPKEDYQLDLGLFTLQGSAGRRWRPTELLHELRCSIAQPAQTIGPLHPRA